MAHAAQFRTPFALFCSGARPFAGSLAAVAAMLAVAGLTPVMAMAL